MPKRGQTKDDGPRTVKPDQVVDHFRKTVMKTCQAEPSFAHFVKNDTGIDTFMLRIAQDTWVYGHTRGDSWPYVAPERFEARTGREAWYMHELALAERSVSDCEAALDAARRKRKSISVMLDRERKSGGR
jgi:hypothetical protein